MADRPKYTPDVQEQFQTYSVASELIRDRLGMRVKPSFEDLRSDPVARVRLIQVFDDMVAQRTEATRLSEQDIQKSPYYANEKAGWDHLKLGIANVLGMGGES